MHRTGKTRCSPESRVFPIVDPDTSDRGLRGLRIECSRSSAVVSDTYAMTVANPPENDLRPAFDPTITTTPDASAIHDSDSSDHTPLPLNHWNTRTRVGRGSRLVATIAAVLAVFIGAGLVTSCESVPGERAAVIREVNASRAAAGLAPLRENWVLDLKADSWAQKMRNACAISHSTLRDGVPGNWRKLGENVGRGGSVQAIHVAYMNSPGHRANVLDPAFNEMGAAAVWGTCPNSSGTMVRTLFTIHVFMKA